MNENNPMPLKLAGLLASLLTCVCMGSAHAQTANPEAPAAPTFAIKGFELQGDNPLSASDVRTVLQPFVRDDATLERLQQAVVALETFLKRNGFGLHRVVLVPQDVGGVVKLSVISFKISKVEVTGNQHYATQNILASIPEMAEGKTPNFFRLAAQTAIANENKGKQIKLALKESDDADSIEAQISVKETKPWGFSASLDNTGSAATGNDRLTVSGSHHNLFGLDHQATMALTSSFEGSAVKQMGFNYKIPLYQQSSVLSVNLTHSDVVGDFGSFQSSGIGQTVGLGYSLYLKSNPGMKRFLNLNLDHKQFGATEINGTVLPGQLTRLSQPLTLGYSVSSESDQSNWSMGLNLASNLAGGQGNDLLAYQSEDPRVATVSWKVLRGDASIFMPLTRGWIFSARTQFQISPQVLIAGEQFGIGGSNSVRGTSERPLAADSGLFLGGEVTSPPIMPGLNLLGFVDAGWLRNRQATDSKPAKDHMASVGLGLRFVRKNITLNMNYGRLVTGSVLPKLEGSQVPSAGDEKLHISLSAEF